MFISSVRRPEQYAELFLPVIWTETKWPLSKETHFRLCVRSTHVTFTEATLKCGIKILLDNKKIQKLFGLSTVLQQEIFLLEMYPNTKTMCSRMWKFVERDVHWTSTVNFPWNIMKYLSMCSSQLKAQACTCKALKSPTIEDRANLPNLHCYETDLQMSSKLINEIWWDWYQLFFPDQPKLIHLLLQLSQGKTIHA